ncbi:GmrSD restriction endonuclease domain-containing protein [Colwellia psychrerythraea]|uniref:DUF262 domain-containing protein n=1 Tax=Colwellia psychrerythraea TaxID=28229 RepID=A0A099KTX5_COLPS|nr:DUF262 domain-containing protein [Colwellia psychrerythraea]KGJ93605.1 protein of unknown function DUF262 [Colwellia psychrerythraea]
MTNKAQDITPLTISQLFSNADYIIPRYQRNYAWGAIEINQLIQDIWDQCQHKANNSYYLGSLVVFERERLFADATQYETIDGQQRHTTLSILLAVFKNCFGKTLGSEVGVNLTFDCRPASETTLHDLYREGVKESRFKTPETSMVNAYVIAENYLLALFNDEKTRDIYITKLWDYFISKVVILRSPVPSDTDLNHYFEIMNNRGEQLEKHEVLKARLMEKVEGDSRQFAFGKIWDACSDMSSYVQYGFNTDVRFNIFGNELNDTQTIFNQTRGFETIVQAYEEAKTNKKNKQKDAVIDDIKPSSISSIFAGAKIKTVNTKPSDDSDERFDSIINFPNFLLHTLKVMQAKPTDNVTDDEALNSLDELCPLDDKRLLDAFDVSNVGAELFVMALLKARYLFDKYIIKRERDKDWSLKRMIHYAKSDSTNYINTFSKDADDYKETEGVVTNINHQVKMLIAMLHVSFPQMIYKNWLSGVLNYLYNQNDNADSQTYLSFLESYNDRIFYGLFGEKKQLRFYQINFTKTPYSTVFNNGELLKSTHIQNYIFNRLDYAIWKYSVVNTINMTIDKTRDMQKICRHFSFSLRSSVEHYYPQTPMEGQPDLVSTELSNGVDSFGNLCLISRSKNSKLSNLLPNAKKDHYPVDAKNIESLKQQLMLSYPQWNSEYAENIKNHEEEMLALLIQKH